jgi:hypothetical protein
VIARHDEDRTAQAGGVEKHGVHRLVIRELGQVAEEDDPIDCLVVEPGESFAQTAAHLSPVDRSMP